MRGKEKEVTNLEKIESTDPLAFYLEEIRKVPLLTREEEGELATQYRLGKKAEARLKEFENDGLRPEERKELEFSIAQGEEAKDRFTKANFRLVVSIAKKYRGRGMDFLDLIQEGNIGLMRAVDKFDPDRGAKFSTFATWCIRQAVSRAVGNQGRTIRIPGHASEELSRFKRKTIELTARFGREPTEEELAKGLGLKPEKVKKIQIIPKITHSLDEPIGVEEDSYLGEFIEDPDGLPPPDEATREARAKQLRRVVDSLTPREAKVLRLRFGLEDGDSRTLEEVGRKIGVTRERARQIQAGALRKLRHPARARKLKDFWERR